MKPTRWFICAVEITLLMLPVLWGVQAWEPVDFYERHDGVAVALVLGFALLAAAVLWSFYALFPPVLHAVWLIRNSLAALLFAAAFAATAALETGINKLGHPHQQRVIATLTRYTNARGASNAGGQGRYGVVQVENGPALHVPLSVIDKQRLKIGDRATVLLYRGPLGYWGWVASVSGYR